MYKYSVSIKKVSGSLNESVLPNKNLVIKSKSELNNESVFNEASKYLKENYGLELESADVMPMAAAPAAPATPSFFDQLRQIISSQPSRSAWGRGVKEYALEMVDNLEEYNDGEAPQDFEQLKTMSLNGARDWSQASEGGSWLIYDEDIAERLCSQSELKKTANGRRRPSARESWLDVQARALHQAFKNVFSAAREVWKKQA